MSPTHITRSAREWSRYYRLDGPWRVEALHAHFVGHRYPRHMHDHFVIGLVERGAQSYSYRGARHITPVGQVFLVNPGEPHTGEAAVAEGYVYRTLCASADLLARVASDVGARTTSPFFTGAVLDDPPLASLLFRFHRSFDEEATHGEREFLLLRALVRLLTRHGDSRVAQKPIGQERRATKRAVAYIESNFAENVPLSRLAALAGLSPYHFARAFTKELGLPPHAYLETVRIRKAREFLDQGETLVSAALSAGYADQSHFTRRFKCVLGITPGQYVRERKIRQD